MIPEIKLSPIYPNSRAINQNCSGKSVKTNSIKSESRSDVSFGGVSRPISTLSELEKNKTLSMSEYVKYSKRTFSSDITIDFPFILKANEILIEDFPPITVFSDKIKYFHFVI